MNGTANLHWLSFSYIDNLWLSFCYINNPFFKLSFTYNMRRSFSYLRNFKILIAEILNIIRLPFNISRQKTATSNSWTAFVTVGGVLSINLLIVLLRNISIWAIRHVIILVIVLIRGIQWLRLLLGSLETCISLIFGLKFIHYNLNSKINNKRN